MAIFAEVAENKRIIERPLSDIPVHRLSCSLECFLHHTIEQCQMHALSAVAELLLDLSCLPAINCKKDT